MMLVHHFTTPESAAAIHAGGFSLRHYGRTSKRVRRDASRDLRGVYVSPGDVPPGYVVPHPYDHTKVGGLVRARLSLKNPLRVPESRSLIGPDETGHEATKRLLKAGHDGVITDTEIIAFDPRSLTVMPPERLSLARTLTPKDEDAAALVRAYAQLKPGKGRGVGGFHRLADLLHEKFAGDPVAKWLPHVLTHPELKVYHNGRGWRTPLTVTHHVGRFYEGERPVLRHNVTVGFGTHRWTFVAPVQSVAEAHEFHADQGGDENDWTSEARTQGLPERLARKTPEELRDAGLPWTVAKSGNISVPPHAWVAHLNERGKAATANMTPEERLEHVTAGLTRDVEAGKHDADMADWYGRHAREMEHGFHRMFGYHDHPDDPRQVFAKVLVGLTSPRNDPNQNVDTTVRMLKAARGDVTRIPAHNEPALDQWMRLHGIRGGTDPERAAVLVPREAPHELGAWAHHHGYTGAAKADYYGVPAAFHPATRRVTHIQKAGKWIPVSLEDTRRGRPAKKANKVWDASTALVSKQVGFLPESPKAPDARGKLKWRPGYVPIHLPLLGPGGKLQAKRWTVGGASLQVGLEGLKSLIAKEGPEGAAAFLTAEHPREHVLAARREHVLKKGTIRESEASADDGDEDENPYRRAAMAKKKGEGKVSDESVDYLPPGEKLAGFLMFGPKIGSFMANIHDSQRLGKYLTADMWFARAFRRHLGELQGESEPISLPERKEMYRVAQEVQRRTGVESIAKLQALLWGHEQALWRDHHQDAESGNLLAATKRAMWKNLGLLSGSGTTRKPPARIVPLGAAKVKG